MSELALVVFLIFQLWRGQKFIVITRQLRGGRETGVAVILNLTEIPVPFPNLHTH